MLGLTPLRRSAVHAAAILTIGAIANAQPGPPPRPDTLPLAVSPGVSFPGVTPSSASAFVLSAARYRVVIASAIAGASLDASSATTLMRTACRGRDQGLTPPPTYDSLPVSVDARQFSVVILPASTARAGCAMQWDDDPVAIWRGLSFDETRNVAPPVPRAIRLFVDDSVVAPRYAVTHEAYAIGEGAWTKSRSQLRYYYPMEALAPRADGVLRRVSIQVWDDSMSSTAVLPELAVRRLALDYAIWRVATASGMNVPVTFALRNPQVPAILPARGSTRQESLRESALQLAPRLLEPVLDTIVGADVSAMVLAEATLAAGDAAAARSVIRSALQRSECLQPPVGTSPTLRAIVSDLRVAACQPRNIPASFAAGLLIPGGGHFASRSPTRGAFALGVVGALTARALSANASANSRYTAYQASHDYTEAPRLYAEATSLRSQARSWMITGAAVWIGDAVIALLESYGRNRLIDRQRL